MPPPPVKPRPVTPRNAASRPTTTMKREEPAGEPRFSLPEGWDLVAPQRRQKVVDRPFAGSPVQVGLAEVVGAGVQ